MKGIKRGNWEVLKSVLSNRGSWINANKRLYELIILPMALFGTEAWNTRSAERRKANVIETKCLIKSLEGVSRMDRVRNRCVEVLEYKGRY